MKRTTITYEHSYRVTSTCPSGGTFTIIRCQPVLLLSHPHCPLNHVHLLELSVVVKRPSRAQIILGTEGIVNALRGALFQRTCQAYPSADPAAHDHDACNEDATDGNDDNYEGACRAHGTFGGLGLLGGFRDVGGPILVLALGPVKADGAVAFGVGTFLVNELDARAAVGAESSLLARLDRVAAYDAELVGGILAVLAGPCPCRTFAAPLDAIFLFPEGDAFSTIRANVLRVGVRAALLHLEGAVDAVETGGAGAVLEVDLPLIEGVAEIELLLEGTALKRVVYTMAALSSVLALKLALGGRIPLELAEGTGVAVGALAALVLHLGALAPVGAEMRQLALVHAADLGGLVLAELAREELRGVEKIGRSGAVAEALAAATKVGVGLVDARGSVVAEGGAALVQLDLALDPGEALGADAVHPPLLLLLGEVQVGGDGLVGAMVLEAPGADSPVAAGQVALALRRGRGLRR